MILKVARIGHPIIRAEAKPVDPATIATPEFQRLIDDMIETMHEYEGVGLAAPQVHVGLRLAVLEVAASDERSQDGVPLTVLINPKAYPIGKETVAAWEGCLSIPELRGAVPRAQRLRLEALDRKGQPFTVDTRDFHARVIQHECDHLNGNVYLDRMRDMKTLSFLPEFERFVLPAHDDDGDEE